jgi:acyl-coenzyme A synthetase/AMP-(fatty) acid ligase
MEVEGALAEHPAVALVAGVGIADLVHGENVRAHVTVKERMDQPTAQELIDLARVRIGYKAPKEAAFLDELPLSATGKVDRAALIRMAEEHSYPTVVAAVRSAGDATPRRRRA